MLSRSVLLGALCAVLVPFSSASDEIPAPPQTGPVAIVGADIYTNQGPPLRGATIVFEKGRITAIGSNVSVSEGATKIDATGKRVYPGLFDTVSNLGLNELGLVRQGDDTSETGSINPNVRADTAINPDSELIPVTRSNGVLLSLVAPEGGVVSGASAVVQLDGWTAEEMTLKSPAAVHVNWPNMRPQTGRRFQRETESEQLRRRDEQLEQIRRVFEDARAYKSARQADPGNTPFDSRWNAMLPLLEGKIPLIVHANDVLQIQSAVAFAAREKLNLIIAGGHDAPLCADLLKLHDVPVILLGTHRLPMRRGEPYDSAYTLPRRLKDMGVRFAIGGADHGNGNHRNLAYNAATAIAYGLDEETALAAITLFPAQILGVADRVGSLEVGKDATLVITDGDILEVPTQIEQAYIQGRRIDLSDKQKRLFEKYKLKYERQKGAS